MKYATIYYSIRCDFFYPFSRDLNPAFVGSEHIPPSLLELSLPRRVEIHSLLLPLYPPLQRLRHSLTLPHARRTPAHLQCSRTPHISPKGGVAEQRENRVASCGQGEIRGVPPWPTRRGTSTLFSRRPSTW